MKLRRRTTVRLEVLSVEEIPPAGPVAPAVEAGADGTDNEWATAWAARPALRGWQHAAAILPAAAAAVSMTAAARSRRERAAAAAWGVGLVGMLASSASYHRLARTERSAARLRKLDHAAIFGAVAGTWTPVALATVPGGAGVALAAGMWGAAGSAAIGKTVMFDRAVRPGSKLNAVYALMGWAGAAVVPAAWRRLGPIPTAALIAGGAAYTAGAVAFAAKRPNPRPATYGYHEVWHTATLVGAGLHSGAVAVALRAIRAQEAR